MMRLLIALGLWLSLATFAPASLYRTPLIPEISFLVFDRLPNAGGFTSRSDIEFLDAWWVRSNDARFGGVSAMHAENGTMLAFSDSGSAMRFALPREKQGELVDIRQLLDGPGPAASKRSRDVEAMAVAGGKVWLAFEHRNAVWRYDMRSGLSEGGVSPTAMQGWPRNGGSEAMLRLADGRFIIFSEDAPSGDGTTEALLFTSDPSKGSAPPVGLRYRAPEGYKITDAAMLSDGRYLFLNRRVSLSGFSAKLTIGRLANLTEGSTIEGEEVATLAGDLADGNFEALSITQENGRDTIWIASDNNFSPRLRTLLLKLALAD